MIVKKGEQNTVAGRTGSAGPALSRTGMSEDYPASVSE